MKIEYTSRDRAVYGLKLGQFITDGTICVPITVKTKKEREKTFFIDYWAVIMVLDASKQTVERAILQRGNPAGSREVLKNLLQKFEEEKKKGGAIDYLRSWND